MMVDATAAARATILGETALVTRQHDFPGDQFVMRLDSPRIAAAARPGQFVHVRCADALPMRRPFSVMRADPDGGWIELLYKVVGRGTAALSSLAAGAPLSLLGPIGQGFSEPAIGTRALLLGGGVGIPPILFLAERLRRRPLADRPVTLLGSRVPFPFKVQPSAQLVAGMPAEAIAAMPLLDDWGIPCRLASDGGQAGCYPGLVTELARHWLQSLAAAQLRRLRLYACGPEPMLRAAAQLAAQFGVGSELCLEEYMACGVGGCAGCVVRVETPRGPAMQRVCVDGPVFAAEAVYPGCFAGVEPGSGSFNSEGG